MKEIRSDILIVGGGIAGCGAAYEARTWGKNLKIIIAEKGNIERSGAAAMGLSALNLCLGLECGENTPEDLVDYVRGDLMGISRDDLVYDIARHVDSSIQLLDEWGLPIVRDEKTGKYLRSGRWQIQIHGESYKPIVAEAAKKAANQIWNRVMVTHLLTDSRNREKIAGAIGFDVRYGSLIIFKSKAVILASGGASHVFRSRSVGEGWGRTWYPPWNAGSAYALPILAGASMVQMEIRLVPVRFKDAYGSDAFLRPNSEAVTTNAFGIEFEKDRESLDAFGKYGEIEPVPNCLKNHLMIQEIKRGHAPIFMHTEISFGTKVSERTGWKNSLDMTVSQAALWASLNIDPGSEPTEIVPTEPYIMGSHAVNAGAWVSGPSDIAPDDYQWGWNRMTTISGLFAAGDAAGGAAHKFSSGSFAEGRIAGKAAVKYVLDTDARAPEYDKDVIESLKTEMFQPLENYEVGLQFLSRTTVSPFYLLPKQGL